MATKNINNNCNNNDRVVPSFISSNSYYGYVAPVLKNNNNDCQQESCVPDVQFLNNGERVIDANNYNNNNDNNNINNNTSMFMLNKIPVQNNNNNNDCNGNNYFLNKSSAMETDDNDNGFNNNHLINNTIPDFERYKNRKRNNTDDLMMIFEQTNGQFKKFKQGGGNKQICVARRGSSQMHNVSSPLCLNLIVNGYCKKSNSNNIKLIYKNNIGKELINSASNNHVDEMLMETHGCTTYHYHTQQQIHNDEF